MTRIPCPVCGGRRIVTHTMPEERASVIHPDGWTGKPVSLTYQTGRMVERRFECGHCHGRGTVAVTSLMPLTGATS